MRYLTLALFAEGPSDQGYLRRIIYRSVVEIGTRLSDQKLDVGERFIDGERYASVERAERIREAFEELTRQGAVNLLFIHSDGGADPYAAREERIAPAQRLLEPLNPKGFRCVPVVPVRETEARALADLDALLAEFGWTGDIRSLAPEFELSRPEALLDPKVVLTAFQKRTAGSVRRGRRQRVESIPAGLGDRASLQKLRTLSAFVEFEADVERALQGMWGI